MFIVIYDDLTKNEVTWSFHLSITFRNSYINNSYSLQILPHNPICSNFTVVQFWQRPNFTSLFFGYYAQSKMRLILSIRIRKKIEHNHPSYWRDGKNKQSIYEIWNFYSSTERISLSLPVNKLISLALSMIDLPSVCLPILSFAICLSAHPLCLSAHPFFCHLSCWNHIFMINWLLGCIILTSLFIPIATQGHVGPLYEPDPCLHGQSRKACQLRYQSETLPVTGGCIADTKRRWYICPLCKVSSKLIY